MSLRNTLRERPIVGTFVSTSSPAVAEILGRSGFELLCFDSEHGVFGPVEIEQSLRAATAVGVAAIVRVSSIGPEIGRALDSGAAGVLVPMVESAEQARAVVSAVRYPPTGARGAGPGRATAYGIDFADYLANSDSDVAAIVQVETRAAVEAVEEIVAVPGIDMVFVGPGDLSVSLGVPGGSPEHTQAIETVIAAARAAGIPVGMFCMTAEAVRQWSQRGVTLFLVAGDIALLAQGATALAAEARAAVLSEVAA